MIYLEESPIPSLQPFVRSLWYCRAPHLPHKRERVLPNGCMQIIVNLSRNYLIDCGEDGAATRQLPRAIVVGARARYEVIDTADMEELVGVAFRPGGFARVLRERADLLFERFVPVDALGLSAPSLERIEAATTPLEKIRTMEGQLCALLRGDVERSAVVDQAIYLFRERRLSVAQCARSVGICERRLSQVFREEVGLSPKTWCRIGRFQSALRALHTGVDVPWAELALRCGYYDQSHFANDFRAFSGIDPTTYSIQRGRWQNHVPIL